MLYYFPEIVSYVILSIDLISLFLFLMVLGTRPGKRTGSFILISVFILPFMFLKILPGIEFLASTPGKLTIVNNSKLYSPVYYMDNNGNVIWVFLTIKGISVSKVFDVEGRTKSMVVMEKNGNYGYVDLEYVKYNANVEINESNLKFDRDVYLTDILSMNKLAIIANYLSHIITLLFLLIILFQIIVFFRNRLSKRNTHIRAIGEIRG